MTTTTQSLFGLITLKVTLPDFKKGAHITVRDNDGIERSGIVIMADGQHNYAGQYLTLKLDVPFEHPRAMIGTITHTISLHVHSDNWIGWVKYPDQHSYKTPRTSQRGTYAPVSKKPFVMLFTDLTVHEDHNNRLMSGSYASISDALDVCRWNAIRLNKHCSWFIIDTESMVYVASFDPKQS